MRHLVVVRHAEAVVAAPGAPDVERSLSARGRRACARLREWADDDAALGAFGPVNALVSGARRTRETFEEAFAGTRFVREVTTTLRIYNGVRAVALDEVFSELAEIDDGEHGLLLVAHSPTVAELVWALTGEGHGHGDGHGDGYPLAGATVIEWDLAGHPVAVGDARVLARYVPEES